jgi:catechol-2,3-dioxygenase
MCCSFSLSYGGIMEAEVSLMIPVTRLNHAVLFVSDVDRSAGFYQRILGFQEVETIPGAAVFMRGAHSENHHDLAVMRAAGQGPARQGAVGLYHLAWQVETIEDLVEAAVTLSEAGALVGMSDHGVSKSLYARDPDGIEFEVMWEVPREQWGDAATQPMTLPLDLAKELQRYGAAASTR